MTGLSNSTITRARSGERLSAVARAEADAERVYMVGFGEQWQHFHFMLLSRPVTIPQHLRGAALFEIRDGVPSFMVSRSAAPVRR